jgi:hypothetical protein
VSRGEYLHLLGEKSALERMVAETPEDDVLDRASLTARLKTVEAAIAAARPDEREPARVRLTFKGRPVIGSHGIFAEFGMKAVNGFAESVTWMAASLTGPLAAMGPIPNREQHQLLITRTALGSFGFELEEHRTAQLPVDDASAVAQALDRTQLLLRGTLGTDDELAEAAADTDRRALDKVRAFLQTLVDNEAVCTLELGESLVSFRDVGQVRTSLARLSQENLREAQEQLRGELQGVLPKSRAFEFKRADTGQVIRGKIAPAITDPDVLNRVLHRPVDIQVIVTRVGGGRPRYLLLEPPAMVSKT